MSAILNKLLSILTIRRKEYLIIDEEFNILETSMGIQRFVECPEDVDKGKDVRLGFPEIFGVEEILQDIIQGNQESFEIKAIARTSSQGTPLYADLYVIQNQYDEGDSNRLIVFLEEVTEQMILEQNLVQSSNEKSLLLSALETSKVYIEKIIISMADALIVTTPSGSIKTINRATQNLLGYEEEELIGQPLSLITSEDKVLLAATQPPLLFQECLNNVEVICQTKVGEKLAIAFSCSAIQTDIEGIQNYIYIGRDITENQRSQRRLAVQYSTTRIMSESASPNVAIPKILQAIGENLAWDVGEFWTLKNGKDGEFMTPSSPLDSSLQCLNTWVRPSIAISDFITNSHQTLLMLGIGLAGHVWATGVGYWIFELAEDTHFLRKEQALQSGLQSGFGFPIESDGEVLGVMAFFTREKQPADEYLLQVMVGVGSQLGQFIKRKQAEVALAESEERYRDLFENATDLIQSCTLKGELLYVNRAWRETLGYEDAQIGRLNLFDILHPDCQAEFLTVFSRVMLGEKVNQARAAFISFEGQKISVEGNINCKFVAGKPVAVRAIFRDITERLAAEAALRYQQEQTERLLLNILPEPIADRLKKQASTIAEDFAEVSVMFADIVGFTQIASQLNPIELIELLNKIFSGFDRLSEKHGLEKIKTIGDAYMVVGGLPKRRDDHAQAIAQMALDMLEVMRQFRQDTGKDFNIRIGIHTGPVVAGVIGIKKFSYDLWGDTVNTASRMESHGFPGKIQVTAATYERLREEYEFEKRGTIQVKGKGEMTTYFLVGRTA
jgi:PAS domain S-box-containing protein